MRLSLTADTRSSFKADWTFRRSVDPPVWLVRETSLAKVREAAERARRAVSGTASCWKISMASRSWKVIAPASLPIPSASSRLGRVAKSSVNLVEEAKRVDWLAIAE